MSNGYSREQIYQMYNTRMNALNKQIADREHKEEEAAYNAYLNRQEMYEKASLALSTVKMAKDISEGIISNKMSETFNENSGGVLLKKYEKRGGFHPFKPLKESKEYKEYKIGESADPTFDTKSLMGAEGEPGFLVDKPQMTAEEYDNLVKERQAGYEEDDYDDIFLGDEEGLRPGESDEAIAAGLEVPPDVEAPIAEQYLQRSGKPGPQEEAEIISKTKEADAAAQAAAQTKLEEMSKAEAQKFEGVTGGYERKGLKPSKEELEGIISKTKEADLETAKVEAREVRAPSKFTAEQEEMQRRGVALPGEIEPDVDIPEPEVEIPDAEVRAPSKFTAEQEEMQRRGALVAPPKDIPEPDVDIPEPEVDVPEETRDPSKFTAEKAEMQRRGVELPDEGVLKRGMKVGSTAAEAVGVASDIKAATEGDEAAAARAAGKAAQKTGEMITKKAGTEVAKKGLGEALTTGGGMALGAAGVYSGLKTAFGKGATTQEKVLGGLQALGSGLMLTGAGAPLGAIIKGGSSLLGLGASFFGKKKPAVPAFKPKIDVSKYYRRSRRR